MLNARATLALAICALAAAAPANATSPTEGTILIAAPSANGARLAYLASPDLNGIAGYVVDLGGAVPDGRSYTLQNTGGTGLVSLAVRFYAALDGTGRPCLRPNGTPDGSGGKTGTVDCGDSNHDGVTNAADRARFAVIFAEGNAGTDPPNVTFSVQVSFRLTV